MRIAFFVEWYRVRTDVSGDGDEALLLCHGYVSFRFTFGCHGKRRDSGTKASAKRSKGL